MKISVIHDYADALLFCILCMLVGAAPALAQDPASRTRPYGWATGVFAASFIAGDSGDSTPPPETRYSDTFGTGTGLRLEAFRNFSSEARAQIGLVYSRWPGKSFAGGQFPAGAQFDDFSLVGPYIGGRATIGGWGGFQPYLLANLGLVHLSSLTVQSGGATIPYWSGSWRDYFEAGVGIARKTGSGTLTFDLRLQNFGAPKSANSPIADATIGLTLLFGVGYEWDARR